MKVLIVTGSYPPMRCGVGDYSHSLVESLVANHEVEIGVLTSVTEVDKNDLTGVQIFPIIKKWNILEIFKIIKVIQYWSPDIVHVQYPTQAYKNNLLPWVVPMIAYLMGKKVVQTWHEIYSRIYAPILFLKAIVPSTLIFVRENYALNLHPHLRWAIWRKNTVFISNASAIPKMHLKTDENLLYRKKFIKKQNRLIVFFGFIYPQKGVELLFEIANPVSDQIIITGQFDENSIYFQKIEKLTLTKPWLGKVTITGFLEAVDAAKLLSVADAVILPFRATSGEWNTSIHSAVLNGAFVITTSLTKSGYDGNQNIYFAKVDNVEEMKAALAVYAGTRRKYNENIDTNKWVKIAKQHYFLYYNLLHKPVNK
jgi:glycosyltransferase involved in cell wall biosynthesis